MFSEKQKNLFILKYFLNPKAIRSIALILIVAVFASTCLLPVSEARAAKAEKIISTAKKGGGGTVKAASGWAGTVISVLVIWGLIEGFLALAKAFVDYMISPDLDLYNLNSSFIQAGWKMIRDICNLFFLLALLFIAFCTILRIEKYNAKKNLLTLILMALLINFSKPIAIFIFDGSQLLMQWFLKGTGESGNITNTLGIYANIGTIIKSAVMQSSILSGAADLLFSIIFVFIFSVVLICLGLFLLIRIVVIWILVIVSPVAFFAMIIPDFRKISSQWWDALFRYSYVGPAIAFFLWLASRMRSIQSKLTAGGSLADAHPMQQMPVFIPYMITIVFLFAALMMANQFGIYFAQTITGYANKFMKWVPSYGYKWFRREYLAKGIKVGEKRIPLSFKVWKDAWTKKTKEREEDVYGDAEAVASDVLSRVFKAGRKPPDYYKRKREAEKIAKYRKEQDSIGTAPEIVLQALKDLHAAKMDPDEKAARAIAYFQTLFSSRDPNEAVKMKYLKFLGMNKPHDAGEGHNNWKTLLNAYGVRGDDVNYWLKRFGEIGLVARDWHLWNLEEEKIENRKVNLYGKLGTIDKQLLQIGTHSEAIYIKDDSGKVVGISGIASPVLARLNETGGDYFNRMRAQTKSDTFSEEGISWLKRDHDALMKAAKAMEATDRKKAEALRAEARDRTTFLRLMAENASKNPMEAKENMTKIYHLTGFDWAKPGN